MSRSSPSSGDRSMPRRSVVQTMLAAGAFGLAGCSSQSPNQSSTAGGGSTGASTKSESTIEDSETLPPGERPVGGTWVAGTTSDASHMVPYLASDQTTQNAIGLVCDWGGVINDDLEIEPHLLKNWEMNESNDVLTLEIRDTLRYSDPYGKLTAEDYMYEIEHIRQNKDDLWHGYPYTGSFYIDGEPIKYEKKGKYKIRAELPKPRANWKFTDSTKWIKPLPKKLLKPFVENKDLKGLKQSDEIVNASWTGNLGAYKLKSWNRQSKMVFERNPDYYLAETDEFKNAPYFDRYVRQIFEEQSTITSSLKTGDVTSAGLDYFKADVFKDRDDVTVVDSKYGPGINFLCMNQRANGWTPFRKKEVRQALALALDKETIINQIYQGYATKAHTWSPKWGPYYDESNVWIPNGPKMEVARKKLQEALPEHQFNGDTFVGPNGNQVSLKLVYVSGWKDYEYTKDYVKSRLEALGFKVTVEGTSMTNLYGNYCQNSAKNTKGVSETDWSAGPWNGGPPSQSTSKEDWDLMTMGFDHAAYTPWDVMKMLFPKKGNFNWWGYVPERDDLSEKISAAANAETKEKTQKVVSNLLGYLSEQQPILYTVCGYTMSGYRKKVAGLEEPKNPYTSNDASKELYFADK